MIQRLHNAIFCRVNIYRLIRSGVKLGENINFLGRIYFDISKDALVELSDNITFTNGGGYNPLCGNICGAIKVSTGAILKIGHNTGISSAHIWAKEKIIIGNHVDIGADCIIMDNDCHSLHYDIRQNKGQNNDGEYIDYLNAKSAPIRIEDNVLIGTKCIILKGVSIGARSIIGAGSVVTKDIPPCSIAAGNPCKVLKKLE